jgi:hypothetical protein
MSAPGVAGDKQRVALANQMGGLLHLGNDTLFLNPAGYNIRNCILSKCKCCCGMPACCFPFTPTIIYTVPDMSYGVEFKKKGAGCCRPARYEVVKKTDFKLDGTGFANSEVMAYTYKPKPENPCWWRCCCYPIVTSCMMLTPLTVYGGLTMACLGSAGSYGTLCTNETIEYGIKHGTTDELLYTFQNDKTGFEKACCGGLAPPVDNKCENCTNLKQLRLFRNVHRTIFDGNSKEGTHSGQGARQEKAYITRTSAMKPMTTNICALCCCAEEIEGKPLGSMQIEVPAGVQPSDDDIMRASLLMYAVNVGWTLFDCCLDNDPVVRASLTIPFNSKGKDPKLFAETDYVEFQTAVADYGILDVGNVIENMKLAVHDVQSKMNKAT